MTGEQVVGRFIEALNAMGARYMVVGAFSSNYYGIPRSTKDADIVVAVESDELSRLRDRVGDFARIDPQASFENIRGAIRHEFTIDAAAFVVGVFELGDDPFARERFHRRVPGTIGDQPAFLPTAEDVIVQKLLWGRVKDIEDVRDVVSVRQGELDWPYIHRWCDEHGTRQMLDRVCAELGVNHGG